MGQEIGLGYGECHEFVLFCHSFAISVFAPRESETITDEMQSHYRASLPRYSNNDCFDESREYAIGMHVVKMAPGTEGTMVFSAMWHC